MEKVSISDAELREMITAAGCDIRQVLTNLQLYSSAQKTMSESAFDGNLTQMNKDKMIMIDYIKATSNLLNYNDFKGLKF